MVWKPEFPKFWENVQKSTSSFLERNLSSELTFRLTEICQNWNLSELEFVRIGICQNSFLLKIGICQNWNLSESEFVRIGNCQNWNLSKVEIISFGPKMLCKVALMLQSKLDVKYDQKF